MTSNRVVAACVGALLTVGLATLPTPSSAQPTPSGRHAHHAKRYSGPVIDVRAGSNLGRVPTGLLGVNQQFNRNGHGVWEPDRDAPNPSAVRTARDAHVGALRFPGGTVANLYDWKRAIGPHRGCQVDAGREALPGYRAMRTGLAFGPDENMEYARAVGAATLIMVPFLNETPGDAADWVEYMNGQANAPGNPNGGVDWADVRARNGHPKPYGVVRWEIGNELNHTRTRHWLSANDRVATRQYAFGDTVHREGEMLGRHCNHRVEGSPSNGRPSQVFSVLYPPLEARTLSVDVDGEQWRQVDDLSQALPTDRVYTVDADEGRVRFGDGLHGAVPPSGSHVSADYDSVHRGYFAFARAMHAVDPKAKVCSSWGNRLFVHVAAGRRYDCLTKHAVTTFKDARGRWDDKVEGHDRMMLSADEKRNGYLTLRQGVPDRIPIWLTEVVTCKGDVRTWPRSAASASSAVATAAMWGNWLRLGVPWVMGDDLVRLGGGLIGGREVFHETARGLTRKALGPMFNARGHQVSADVVRNPTRYVEDARRHYTGLSVTATRSSNGTIWLLVANRLPFKDVSARIRLSHMTTSGRAVVRRVTAAGFSSWNRPGARPSVHFSRHGRDIGRQGFTATFPATSTTVIAIRRR